MDLVPLRVEPFESKFSFRFGSSPAQGFRFQSCESKCSKSVEPDSRHIVAGGHPARAEADRVARVVIAHRRAAFTLFAPPTHHSKLHGLSVRLPIAILAISPQVPR